MNHGPASAYGIGNKAVALVDVVLPKGTVATGNAFEEGEDGPYGECFLWVSGTKTAPFAAGHRHYVCPVPRGVAAGKSQLFVLWVKSAKDYTGAKGTATVLPGPAGIPLHDPDPANDSVTFAFDASAASPTSSASSPTSGTSGTPGASGGASATCGRGGFVRRDAAPHGHGPHGTRHAARRAGPCCWARPLSSSSAAGGAPAETEPDQYRKRCSGADSVSSIVSRWARRCHASSCP